jgi:hypothetical protein
MIWGYRFVHCVPYKIGDAYFLQDGNHRVSVAKYHKVATIDAEVVEIRGHMRTDAAQRGASMAGAPTHRPQHPPTEPGASWLHKLWQRLRPPLLRWGARPAMMFVVGVVVILTLTVELASTAVLG